jgi:hypothetical protein
LHTCIDDPKKKKKREMVKPRKKKGSMRHMFGPYGQLQAHSWLIPAIVSGVQNSGKKVADT